MSGIQQDEQSAKSSDRMNPVLSFNCDGDIRTKKDLMQPIGMTPSMSDQQNMPMYSNQVLSKSHTNSSSNSSFVHGMSPFSHVNQHGSDVMNAKNHSENNIGYPFQTQEQAIVPSSSHSSLSNKQSMNSSHQYPSGSTSMSDSMHQSQNVHMNSISSMSVGSPNHLGMSRTDFGLEGSHNDPCHSLTATHTQSSVNDSSSKVNLSGAISESGSVPLVKLEKLAMHTAPLSNELPKKSSVKVFHQIIFELNGNLAKFCSVNL